MLLLAAAIAATSMPSASAGASVQATATIRVISGAQLNLMQASNGPDVPSPRTTSVTTADGTQPARLIEFQ